MILGCIADDFTGATLLYFANPIQRAARERLRSIGVTGVLAHAPFAIRIAQGINAYDHALHTKRRGKLIDELWTLERR